jgi:hypothetical protein
MIPTSCRTVRNVSTNSGEIRIGYLPQRRADPESGMSLYIKVLARRRSTADISCTRRYGSCPVMPSGDACSNYATLRHSHKHFTFTATLWPSLRYLSLKYSLCRPLPRHAEWATSIRGSSDRRADVTIMTTWSTVLTSCDWRSLVLGIEMRDCSKVPASETPEKQFYESDAGMATLWQIPPSSWPLATDQTVKQIVAARVRSQTTSVRIRSSQTGVSRSTVNIPPGKIELTEAADFSYCRSVQKSTRWARRSFCEECNHSLDETVHLVRALHVWGSVHRNISVRNSMRSSGAATILPPVWNSSVHTKRVRFLYFFEDKGVRFGCQCTKHHF